MVELTPRVTCCVVDESVTRKVIAFGMKMQKNDVNFFSSSKLVPGDI